MAPDPSTLPPEAIAFATRMYDAARAGQMNVFQQALPAGLPANMTNDKGDSLVHILTEFIVFELTILAYACFISRPCAFSQAIT
jgi:hypothetical protein